MKKKIKGVSQSKHQLLVFFLPLSVCFFFFLALAEAKNISDENRTIKKREAAIKLEVQDTVIEKSCQHSPDLLGLMNPRNLQLISTVRDACGPLTLGLPAGVYDKSVLADHLRTWVLSCEKQLGRDIHLVVPDSFEVKESSFFNKSYFTQKIIDELKSEYPEVQFSVDRISYPQLSCRNQNVAEYAKIVFDERGAYSLKLIDAGKSYWITGQVLMYKLLPVTTRQLKKDEIFNQDDFSLVWQKIQGGFSGGRSLLKQKMPATQDILGRAVKTYSLGRGSVIYFDHLRMPQEVRAGDTVQVFIRRGDFAISVQAESLDSGSIGEIVRVKNLESKKTIKALVIAKNQVEIE